MLIFTKHYPNRYCMNAKVEEINSSELIEEIESFDVDAPSLMVDMKTSEATIRQYKKNPKTFVKRTKTLSKFILLRQALTSIKKLGYKNPYLILKQLNFNEVSAFDIINNYPTSNLTHLTINMLISTLEPLHTRRDPLNDFREIYRYINTETLELASSQDPDLLISIFDDESVSPLLKGEIIEAFALGAKENRYEFIKAKWSETSAFIRESVAIGLFEYRGTEKSSEVNSFLKEKLETETAPGVRQTLSELLKEMEFETNVYQA